MKKTRLLAVLILIVLIAVVYFLKNSTDFFGPQNNVQKETQKPPERPSIRTRRVSYKSSFNQDVYPYLKGGVENIWNKDVENQDFNVVYQFEVEKYHLLNNNNFLRKKVGGTKFQHYREELEQFPATDEIHGYTHALTEDFDYFPLNASKIVQVLEDKTDDGERFLNLTIGSLINDKAIWATAGVHFKILTPSYCSIYSFAKSSGDFFLICLSQKVSSNLNSYLILGYSLLPEKESSSSYSLVPIFNQTVEEEVAFSVHHSYYADISDVIHNKPGQYLIVMDSYLYILEPDASGRLAVKEKLKPPGETDSTSEENLSERIYLGEISQNKDYILYTTANSGGVLDLKNTRLLPADKSCFAETPKRQSSESRFFNYTVDPFQRSPYKTLELISWKDKEVYFKQSFCSGGGCSQEGTIRMFIGKNSVSCEIEVKLVRLEY